MKLPPSSKNWITIIGGILAAIAFSLIIILFLLSSVFKLDNTNLGLFIYIILPGFFVLGLLLIPIGILRERRRMRKSGNGENKRLPMIDLNNPSHRSAFIFFAVSTVIILILSTLGSFKAYHITESVEFCGKLCHKVMEPEHTAYQNSPHANLLCVECHVGAGASWYVKSKLSGLHQIYAVLADDYDRPIQTPLHDLRPARETCERCHWPQKFYSRSLVTNKYFLADSLNSEWDILLQMKTGPEYSAMGLKEGIHWHINPAVSIDYISENDKRENIIYVRYKNLNTGETIIYNNAENAITDSIVKSAEMRTMDCIDCHNRPSHKYKSPTVYFDQAMIAGRISRQIPFIKKTSMEILRETFTDKDSALMRISEGIGGFYRATYPDYYKVNNQKIDSAVTSIKESFSLNAFPRMKVSYDVYPDHIGHLETNGCFRCHNDQFVSQNGRKITRDCNLCHTIVGQGNSGAMEYSNIRESLQFRHPVDVGTAWAEANCSECHLYLY